MTSPALTTVAQDYLKVIWTASEYSDEPVSTKMLASKMCVSPSTVSEAVRKLADQGLVDHARYGAITLTDAGRRAAISMVRRHRLIETWLVEEMGYGWDEVHDEAEVLEHTISDRLLTGIDARLGHPRFDPHGDAIPGPDGSVEREPFVLLAEATIGHTGRVLRVSDRDPALLRSLEEIGIDVGHTLTATGRGAVQIDGGPTIELPPAAAQAVWLTA